MRYFHSATLTQSATPTTPPPSGARTWFSDGIPTYTTPTPTGSGIYRDVASYNDWLALESIAGPGDVIRIISTIQLTATQALGWDGRNNGANRNFPSGTEANPITITCINGAEIRSVTSWVEGSQYPETLLIIAVDHVHAVGVHCRDGMFGVRVIEANGTAAAPIKIWHNISEGARDANIYVGSAAGGNATLAAQRPCSYVSVMYNTAGVYTPGDVFTNEGIYVGLGTTTTTWLDTTHDVEIGYNDIYGVQGDGIDIKLGCYNIDIHHNKVHDVAADFGSGISTGVTNSSPGDNPNPAFNANITIRSNWVWNIGYDIPGVRGVGAPFGMYVSKPGTRCYNNVIWSLRSTSARGMSCGSYVQEGSQPIQIYNNTIICEGTAIAYFVSGGSVLNMQYSNNISNLSGSGVTQILLTDFVGPVPTSEGAANRTNVTADAGNGPGTGYIPLVTATNIVGQASGATPTADITNVARPQGGTSDRGAYEVLP